MRIEKLQSKNERKIIIAMIVNDIVLGRVSAQWQKELFSSKWANTIGTWCVQFYNKYSKAPGKDIQGLYEVWASKCKDKDVVLLVEKFLTGLSSEFDSLGVINSDVLIDLAAEHFTKVKIQTTIERVQGHLDDGSVVEAATKMTEFNSVQMGQGAPVDVLENKEVLKAAFDDIQEDLIQFPGDLGLFFKGQLVRDAFIAILAPEKRGKSFWLIEFAWMGMLQRKRVLFISAGDMSERQMMRRFAVRASGKPLNAKKWPLVIQVPKRIRKVKGEIQVKYMTKTFEKPLSMQEASDALDAVRKERVKGKDYLRMLSFPSSTLSVKQMQGIVEQYSKDGWDADIVIADYADILDEDAALPGSADPRHKTNASWSQQRKLSGSRHVLYITATQADANSYEKETMTRSNFSNDKRKLAHVTGMFAINQTQVEKDKGIFRLNWVALREGSYSEGQTIAVAGNLSIGRPCITSCL